MDSELIHAPWNTSVRKALKYLDGIDLNPYFDATNYIDVKDVVKQIEKDYNETSLNVFCVITEQEFCDYIKEHYNMSIVPEVTITYWIKKTR